MPQIWPFLPYSKDATKEQVGTLREDLNARFGKSLTRPVSDVANVLVPGEHVLVLSPLSGVRYHAPDGRHLSHGSGGRDGAYNEVVLTGSRLFLVTSLGWLAFNLTDLAAPSPLEKSKFSVADSGGNQLQLNFATLLPSRGRARAASFRDELAQQIEASVGGQ